MIRSSLWMGDFYPPCTARFEESKGVYVIMKLNWDPTKVDQGQVMHDLSFIRDMIEAKRLPKRLREYEEGYRKQISRELHDGIGQALSTMGLYVSLAKETLREDQEAAIEHLSRLESLLERTVEETHRMAMNLRPSIVDDMGLVPALRFLYEDFGDRTGIGVNLKTNLAGHLEDRDVETALYRMAQEGLCNIEKHASATQTAIELDRRNSKLILVIKDNGSGFDVQEASNKGMGLISMQERACLLGGHAAIKSKRNEGTEIRIEVCCKNFAETEVNRVRSYHPDR
jgi:signal transduction histidine kinase